MLFKKIQLVVLAMIISLVALFILIDLLGTAAPVMAQQQEVVSAKAVEPQQAKPSQVEIDYTIYTTDPRRSLVQIQDLSGNMKGEGLHFGRVKCKGDNCSQSTTLVLDGAEYDYKFSYRQAHDPEARRLVVQGTGYVTNDRQKERFLFTAVFEDNRNGTFRTTYEASRPDASFIVPSTPGNFEIGSK